ncbi:LysE family translocator [Enterobacter cloacae]|uniref:LysE family translocator n=1 Tax=Enterobacter cloacae subsp. cloacae TaxID=336306 RepID=A0AAE2JPX1_ENTCL|nr:hypothetical protein [Enterobacter cloacae]KJM35107.1 hypothetical protein SS44_15085 [Enterobacter cloacae subsp. cloacae]
MLLNDCIKIMGSGMLLLVMPGPTNTLLLFSGYASGIRPSIKMIIAEWGGYFCAITFWGVIVSVLAQHGAFLLGIIKLLSAFYVAWLAVKVWGFSLQSRPTKIGMKTIFITTLFNPKSFVFATYIIPSIAFRELQSFTAAMLSVFVALLPLSFIWVACGKGIARQGKLQSRLWPMFFYRGLSLAMASFAASMVYHSVAV